MSERVSAEQSGTEDAERAALRALIESHHGNQSHMAAALGLANRENLRRRLAALGLLEEAEQARARAGVSGPRNHLSGSSADPAGDQRAIAAAIAEHGGYRGAAKALGISPRTLIRKMQRLGLAAGGKKKPGLSGRHKAKTRRST